MNYNLAFEFPDGSEVGYYLFFGSVDAIMRANDELYIYRYTTSIIYYVASGSQDNSSVATLGSKLATIAHRCSTLSRMFCTVLPKLTHCA
jgi:hypothetical protein